MSDDLKGFEFIRDATQRENTARVLYSCLRAEQTLDFGFQFPGCLDQIIAVAFMMGWVRFMTRDSDGGISWDVNARGLRALNRYARAHGLIEVEAD